LESPGGLTFMTEFPSVPQQNTGRYMIDIVNQTQETLPILRGSLGIKIDNAAFTSTANFFTELAPLRRTTFNNQAEALELATGVYNCRREGETLGIQGVLASSTALTELPYFVRIVNLAREAGLQPDLHLLYVDWDYYPSQREGKPKNDIADVVERVKELGIPAENLHNLSENTPEGRKFQRMFQGQWMELEKAKYDNSDPRHPLSRPLIKWKKHYLKQQSDYYALLQDRERGVRSLMGEFKTQVFTDASNRRALCIQAAEQKRKLIGSGKWGYSLFVTTEKSPVELAQYNAAVPFLKPPGAKKDRVQLPIVNLDVSLKIST